MFYHCENTAVELIGVERLCWKATVVDVPPRNFSALAFRLRGDALVGGRYVAAGEVLYLPQGLGYHAEYSDTEMVVFHVVTARRDEAAEVFTPANGEEVGVLFAKAHAVWKARATGYRAKVLALFYEILGRLCVGETEARLPAHFSAAVSALNGGFRNAELSIGAVCRDAGVGETAFRRLFKKYYRITPVEYLTDLRLEHARTLLAAGESVENAATESGFRDPKYFARVVRKKFGCSPRAWRNYGK